MQSTEDSLESTLYAALQAPLDSLIFNHTIKISLKKVHLFIFKNFPLLSRERFSTTNCLCALWRVFVHQVDFSKLNNL